MKGADVTILAGRLIDPSIPAVLERRTIHIGQGRIRSVVPGLQPATAGERVIDASDRCVLPGMIDPHCHLTFSAGPNHEVVRQLLAEEGSIGLTVRAVANAQAHLAGGVTTLRDTGGPGFLTLDIRRSFAAGVVPVPRMQACGPAITPPSGHLHYLGAVARGVDEVRRWSEKVLEAGADFVKVCASGGIMTAESDPMDPHYSADELRAAVEVAERRGTLVAAHTLCAEGLRRCVDAGVRSIEHCLFQEAAGDYRYDAEVAERMIRQECVAGLTYAGLSQARYLEDHLGVQTGADLGVWRSRLEARYASERALVESGVRYVLHSDAGVRETPFGPFWLILATAAAELGISPLEAIRAVTVSPAELLGWAGQVGSLVPGAWADLLIVDGDPAGDLRALRRPGLVLKAGEVVAAGGNVLTGGEYAG